MHLAIDDFALFGLPRRFALDRVELDARRRSLQGEVHPDRFAAADPAARRAAMESAVRVNDAHQRLRDPLKRAAYLCELGGVAIDAEDNTAMPAGFLDQQMAWREALDAAATPAEVDSVAATLDRERRRAYDDLAAAIDDAHDLAHAAQGVRALMFVERFAADVERRQAELEA